MSEIWLKVKDKDVENYEVSNRGRIRNATTGRLLKLQIDRDGYLKVILSNNGRAYNKFVHTLVANAFLDSEDYQGDPEYMIVGFLDGDRSNVCADNLAYMSRAESIQRSFNRGRKQTHIFRRVRCVETGEEFDSIEECSRVTGISRNAISRVANRRSLRTKDGLHFELVE